MVSGKCGPRLLSLGYSQFYSPGTVSPREPETRSRLSLCYWGDTHTIDVGLLVKYTLLGHHLYPAGRGR